MSSGRERRVETRYKVSFRAVISGLDSKEEIPCLIRDASRSGCRVVSSKSGRIPDVVKLTVEDMSEPIEGTVMWRTAKMVGVRFKWELSQEMFGAAEPLDDETAPPSPMAESAEMRDIAKRFSARPKKL